MSLPKAVQQIVDTVTEERRHYVATTLTNWCGYNDHGIRIAVIFPQGEGWSLAGVYVNPWARHNERQLRVFRSVEDAKQHTAWRNPTIPLRWESVEVAQGGPEFEPMEASDEPA